MTERKCDDILKRLPDYQAGSLEQAERASVDAHLAACSSCRTELTALERTAAVLDDTKARAPSRDLWPGIAAQLRPRRAARPWWQTLLPQRRPWAVAAAVVMVLLLVVGVSVLLPPTSHHGAPLVAQVDEEAPVFVRWHAQASLGTGAADPYALAVVVSRQTTRLEEMEPQ